MIVIISKSYHIGEIHHTGESSYSKVIIPKSHHTKKNHHTQEALYHNRVIIPKRAIIPKEPSYSRVIISYSSHHTQEPSYSRVIISYSSHHTPRVVMEEGRGGVSGCTACCRGPWDNPLTFFLRLNYISDGGWSGGGEAEAEEVREWERRRESEGVRERRREEWDSKVSDHVQTFRSCRT